MRSLIRRPAARHAAWALVTLAAFAVHAEPPDLTGRWLLNAKESEDPRKMMRKATPPRDRFERDEDGGRGRSRALPLPDAARPFTEPWFSDSPLQISAEGPRMSIDYADGTRRTFYTDGRSRIVSAREAPDPTGYSSGYWDGDALVVQTQPRDGGRIVERFELSADRQHLRVKMQARPIYAPFSFEVERVYDSEAAAAAAQQR